MDRVVNRTVFNVSSLTGLILLIGKMADLHTPLIRWTVDVHKSLLLGEAGSLIIGVSCLLGVFEILSGYLILGKVAQAQIISARLRGKSVWHGFLQSLSWKKPNAIWGMHVSGGFWCGVPFLLMILTGLTWSFGWYADMIFSIFGSDASWTLFHSIYNLHAGLWDTPASEILWIVSTLIATTLPVTGLLLFLKRNKK